MTKSLVLALAAIAATALGGGIPDASAAPGKRTNQISGPVEVVSGGIITVGRQEVHLWGIEAAGLHQPCMPRKKLTCGEYGRIALQQMTAEREVWCDIKERPANALHVIARCELRQGGGRLDLSSEMVRLGYAYAGTGRIEEAAGPYARMQPRVMPFKRPWIWRERYASEAASRNAVH